MNHGTKRAYRPGVEGMEERCVTAAGLTAAGLGVHAAAAFRGVGHAGVGAAWAAFSQAPQGLLRPGGPNGGINLIKLGLPSNFLDYGVVTLWNNTNTVATFAISASTFRNGQFFTFTLRRGEHQSFFAPVVNGILPLFQVSFQPNLGNRTFLPRVNVVFESPRYVPAGTAGWPYAIGIGVNGYFLRQI